MSAWFCVMVPCNASTAKTWSEVICSGSRSETSFLQTSGLWKYHQMLVSIAPSSLARLCHFLGRWTARIATILRLLAFAGPVHCVSGSAKGLVVDTGDRTVFGRIAKLTSTPKKGLTPLQKEIYHFITIIVCLMLTMIVIVIAVWAGWLRKAHPNWISVPVLIVDCVSVAVAFIPEGLPIAVTASLTITANIMMRNKVLCKSLKTVETLGAVNVVCSGKTGTLTRNIMAVTEYLIGKEAVAALKAPGIYDMQKGLQKLATVAAVCDEAESHASTMNQPIIDRKVIGDATDSAIIRFVEGMHSITHIRSA